MRVPNALVSVFVALVPCSVVGELTALHSNINGKRVGAVGGLAHALYLSDAGATTVYCDVSADDYGVYATGATATRKIMIADSWISGTLGALYSGANYSSRLEFTGMFTGGISGAGTVTCVAVRSSAGTFYANACP
jgi:hypothetical protein